MPVIVEPKEPEAPVRPDAGVIRDARVRRTARRQRNAAALTAIAAIGALIAWSAGSWSSKSSSAGNGRARVAFQRAKQRRRARGWYISPALEGGSYGWCVLEPSSGSCASVPAENPRAAHGTRAIGTIVGSGSTAHEERITALLASDVHGVLVDGRAARVLTRAQLSYGLRIAQIVYPRKVWTEHASSLVATGANGKPLGDLGPWEHEGREPVSTIGHVRWWEKPQSLAPGPCQIRAHGLPALTPEWGHVAARVRPYAAKIIGRAFFSCIDTEYYLHNWPLETSILLDAQHPGAFPAAIPGMKPITGEPGLFWAPGDWHGEITATRNGNAWVVVAGGSGLHQREEVLHHLTASVRL